jgi:hypothetical protein
MLEAMRESSRYGNGLNGTGNDGLGGELLLVTSRLVDCQSLFDVRLAINRELKANSDERKFDDPGLEHIKAGREGQNMLKYIAQSSCYS